jgi:hypothetical protein
MASASSFFRLALSLCYVMHDGGKIYGHMSAKGNQHVTELIAARLM